MRADDAWRAVAELAASQHGVLTRRQAANVGLDRNRIGRAVADGRLGCPIPGVLVVPGTPATFRHRLMVAVLAGGGTVASHRAACLLHGLDIDAAPVEVLVRRGRYPDIDGVIVHRTTRLDDCDITVVDGIPCTTVARTLCDVGAVLPQEAVERMLDSALRRGVPLRWIEDTLRRVDRPGPSGPSVLKRIVADPRRSGGVPANWFERLVRRAVDATDLPPVVLQHTLRGPGGRVVARFDAAIPEWRIGVEAHSAEWHDRPGRVWRDLERDNEVKALGWDIVYVTWDLAKQPDAVVDLIRRTRRARLAS